MAGAGVAGAGAAGAGTADIPEASSGASSSQFATSSESGSSFIAEDSSEDCRGERQESEGQVSGPCPHSVPPSNPPPPVLTRTLFSGSLKEKSRTSVLGFVFYRGSTGGLGRTGGSWGAGREPAPPPTYRFHNSENVSWLRGGSMVSSNGGSCIVAPGRTVRPLWRERGSGLRHTQPRGPPSSREQGCPCPTLCQRLARVLQTQRYPERESQTSHR